MPGIAELFVSIGADISGATKGLNSLHAQLNTAASSVQDIGGDLSRSITAPIVAAGGLLVKFGADFEHAFTQVAKTTNLSAGELETLRKGIVDLSTTAAGGGKSAEELAGIAAVAGQLGIEGSDNLLRFTKIAAGLSVATGIPAAQVGEDLTRIAVLTKTPSDAWENMASTIVGLGNEMAGSEQEIIDLSLRLSGALGSLGVPAQDILGISSALAALGVNAEAGGTAVSTFFIDMVAASSGAARVSDADATKIQNLQDRIVDLGTSLDTARAKQQAFGRNTPAAEVQNTAAQIDKYQRELEQAHGQLSKLQQTAGGGNIDKFAAVAGVTADQFRSMIKENPAKAFEAIVHGLARIGREQGPQGVIQALEDIGVNEARQRDALLRLSQGEDTLTKGIGVANAAWAENSAQQTEVERAMADTENQFNLLLNQLKALAIDVWPTLKAIVGDFFALIRTEAIPRLQELSGWWASLEPAMQQNIVLWAGIAAAAGPALVVLGLLVGVLGALLSPIGLVLLAVGALAAAWLTNFGDIQGKTAAVVGAVMGIAEAVGNVAGRILSAWATIWVLIVTVAERALREVGNFFGFLLQPLQQVGQWIADNILGPLLGLLRMLGEIVAATGIGGALGGLNINDMVRQGEAAIGGLSQGIAAGGPGTANSVVVNINNPTVPDQTVAERFAAEVKAQVISALVQSEKESQAPPSQFLPGALGAAGFTPG